MFNSLRVTVDWSYEPRGYITRLSPYPGATVRFTRNDRWLKQCPLSVYLHQFTTPARELLYSTNGKAVTPKKTRFKKFDAGHHKKLFHAKEGFRVTWHSKLGSRTCLANAMCFCTDADLAMRETWRSRRHALRHSCQIASREARDKSATWSTRVT